MPTRELPHHPSLVHFKHQAKDLLAALRKGEQAALAKLAEFHPRYQDSAPPDGKFALSDAQLTVAREYGFPSWPKLRDYLATIESFACSPHKEAASAESHPDEFLRLICLSYGSDHPSRREKAAKLLADHPEIRGANIHVAAAMGDVSAIQRFLSAKRELASERSGPHRWEPILYLTYSRYAGAEASFVESARLLLAEGANPNAAYLWDAAPYLFTALTGCFGEGESGPVNQPPHRDCEALARLLLEAGADPNDSQTLYNRQFTRGTSHLELLLAYGLGKPAKSDWEKRLGGKLISPEDLLKGQLHWAVSEGHLDRVKLLVANGGIDLEAPSRGGKTPYEVALVTGHKEIAAYLLEHGAREKTLSPQDRFAAACASADREDALAVIREVPDIVANLGARRGRLLASAAGSNRIEAVRLMVELGFNPSELQRNTPLHEAAWAGHLAMVKLLVELGADPTLRDREHNARPVDWATHNGKQEVADYLNTL